MTSQLANGRVAAGSSGPAAANRPLMTAHDVEGLVEPVKQWIIQYPTAALASAFLAGVAIAWWIKRK